MTIQKKAPKSARQMQNDASPITLDLVVRDAKGNPILEDGKIQRKSIQKNVPSKTDNPTDKAIKTKALTALYQHLQHCHAYAG